MYVCLCTCGNTKLVLAGNLKRGDSKSCGCLRKELASTHGQSSSITYLSWQSMWQRTTNPNSKDYATYKDRAPPEAWRDFATFIRDMGERPSKLLSLERINNLLPYSKENCIWATSSEQGRNKSSNRLLKLDGVTRTLVEWTEITGLSSGTVYKRLSHGWTEARTLSTPVRRSEARPLTTQNLQRK